MKQQPNICTYCSAPLTGSGRCISPACATNAVCDFCGQGLTIRGRCPDPTCPNAFIGDSIEPPVSVLREDVFTRTTVQFMVEMIGCDVCGLPYESVLMACPHCADALSRGFAGPPPVDGRDDGRETVPCPFDVTLLDPDVSANRGLHMTVRSELACALLLTAPRPDDRDTFWPECNSGVIRRAASTAPPPDVEISVEDVEDLEPWEAEIFEQEADT